MQSLTRITTQTLWQSLGKLVTVITTFIILAVVSRNYGEEGTGMLTLALTYINMFFLISDFGLNVHIQRVIENLHKEKQELIWRKLLGARLITAFILIIISISILPFFKFASNQFIAVVIFGSLSILGSSIFLTTNLIFQRKFRYDLSVSASSIGAIVYLVLVLFFAFSNFPIYFLTLALTLNWMMTAFLVLFFVKRYFRTIVPIIDVNFMINGVKSAWPIGATLFVNVVYFRADSFLIAFFRSVSESGIYNIAFQFFQAALVLPTFIMNSYYPIMLKSFKDIKIVGAGLILLSFLITFLTFILAPFLVRLLTGGGFEGADRSLQILSLGFPGYFLSALLMWILVTRGFYKKLFLIYAFGLLINLTLNLIFIPIHSFYAASAVTVISEYLILLMLTASLLL